MSLINVLSAVDESQAWLFHEPVPLPAPGSRDGLAGAKAGGPAKATGMGLGASNQLSRRVVTLQHIRRDYQAELDRVSAIEHGRIPLIADDGDEMDVL